MSRRLPATPPSRSPPSPTTAARSARHALLLRSRPDARRARFRPGGARGGRGGAGGRARARPAVTQVRVADARAAMAPLAARFCGDPTAELQVAGITGTNGKTTTAFLLRRSSRPPGRRPGCWARSSRSSAGSEEEVERTTPEAIDLQATFRRMLDAGDARLRDGGLLARAGPAPRRRDPLRRRRLHQPDPGPPRLPRRHGGLLRGQAAAVRCRRRRRRSSTSTTPTGGGSPRTSSASRSRPRARRPTSAPRRRLRRIRRRLRGRGSRGEVEVRTRLPGHFNVANALAALAAADSLGVAAERRQRRSPARPGCRVASSRSTRARPSPSSSTTPTPPTRWRTCCGRRAG